MPCRRCLAGDASRATPLGPDRTTLADAVGRRLLSTGYAPLLRQYARQGVPAGLRGGVWLLALGVGAVSERDHVYYEALRAELRRVTLATDDFVKRDAAAPAREEDYFVFLELVEEIMLAFCRDPVRHTARRHRAPPSPDNTVRRHRPTPPSDATVRRRHGAR